MSLFKPKFIKKIISAAVYGLVLVAILANLLKPTMVRAAEADLSEIGAYFSQNFDIRPLSSTPNATGGEESPEVIQMPTLIDQKQPDKVVKAVITAYTSTVDQCDDDPFIAASGKRVYDGMIAANWLPMGTKIKIPALYGDKIFTVDDRMNARYGYGRMDIWLDATKGEARKFGVKRVEVEVYYAEKAIAKK